VAQKEDPGVRIRRSAHWFNSWSADSRNVRFLAIREWRIQHPRDLEQWGIMPGACEGVVKNNSKLRILARPGQASPARDGWPDHGQALMAAFQCGRPVARPAQATKNPGMPGFPDSGKARLRSLDFCRLLALGAGDDIKADALVFLQRLEAASLDRREVREEILATAVRRNKTKALGVVEPLNSTCFHCVFPLINLLGQHARSIEYQGKVGNQRYR